MRFDPSRASPRLASLVVAVGCAAASLALASCSGDETSQGTGGSGA
jgi:hypothetical protein